MKFLWFSFIEHGQELLNLLLLILCLKAINIRIEPRYRHTCRSRILIDNVCVSSIDKGLHMALLGRHFVDHLQAFSLNVSEVFAQLDVILDVLV